MIERIISFSIKNKIITIIGILFLIIAGLYSLLKIPLDAVPDITNNQVQIVTVSPSLAPQEVEKLITYPLEISLANIPNTVEIRSISKYGLSVITVVFEECVPTMLARQYVNEQISVVKNEIPQDLGSPELMPITTGLGEIYQYSLVVDDEHKNKYNLLELRNIQDWIVKRELSGTKGVIEVSSFGGYVKQYEITIDPDKLNAYKLTLSEVFDAISMNNANSGSGYIEKNTEVYYIRIEGLANNFEELKKINIKTVEGTPLYLGDIASINFNSPKRYGAMTKDGEGEIVGGIALMLKGANSYETINNIKDKVDIINKSLPEGVKIEPYLERTFLIDKTIATVSKNLIEGGLIVIFILVLLLGNYRGGIIVASVIPLSMLFALLFMNLFGVSANLMSLGAIDFGIIIDGAVIIVEGILSTFHNSKLNRIITKDEKEDLIKKSASKIYKSAFFGVMIILIVFVPILSLDGIEGKMFKPMAQTLIFAITGSLILSITYVPMVSSLFLSNNLEYKENFSDKIIKFLQNIYKATLTFAFKIKSIVVVSAVILLMFAFYLFSLIGAEFLPQLEEGDLAMQMTLEPGTSLTESINKSTQIEKVLLSHFPEVKSVVSKIGTAEIPTDPMSIESADIMVLLKDKEEWESAKTREDLVSKMSKELEIVFGATIEFSQPIQLRFNELMTGSKSDVAIQVFGDNLEELKNLAEEISSLIANVEGANDIKAEVTEGLKIINIKYDREKISRMGVNIDEVNNIIKTFYLGTDAGYVIENDRKYDLVVRSEMKNDTEIDLNKIFVRNYLYELIPVSTFANLEYIDSPILISRDQTKRRISVGVNIRGRDTESVIEDIQKLIDENIKLPPAYYIKYGGQFENLQSAKNRLFIVLPLALAFIFAMLYFAFNSVKSTVIIFTAIPFSVIGGIVALFIRDMPFSISAGIGFIALFGISVLNGIVLLSHFEEKKKLGLPLEQLIFEGALSRLRPVIMTALVAALGFIPMALSTGLGAEVQKPLATVVIGGLISSTILTLILLPIFYYYFYNKKTKINMSALTILILPFLFNITYSQDVLSKEEVISKAIENSNFKMNLDLQVKQSKEYKRITNPMGDLNIQSNLMDNNSETEFQAVQNFNNIFAISNSSDLAKNYVDLAEANSYIKLKEFIKEIEDKYAEWKFLYSQSVILDTLILRNNIVLSNAKLKHEKKSISDIDLNIIKSNHLNLQNQMNKIKIEYNAIRAEILSLIKLENNNLNPKIDYKGFDSKQNSELDYRLLEFYENKIKEAQYQSKIHDKSKYPDFGIGYMHRNFPNSINSNGLAISLSFPLFNNSYKTERNQTLIQSEIYQNEYNQLKLELTNKLSQLINSYNYLEENETDFDFENSMNALYKNLELGNISNFEFYQTLHTFIQAKLSLLEIDKNKELLLNQINFLTIKKD